MSDYAPPLQDIKFVLDHLTPLDELAKLPVYEEIDADSVYGVIEEFGRLMSEVWAPTNAVGDHEGSKVEGDTVKTATGFKEAYQQYADAGWGAVPFAPEYGGGGFPWLVGIVQQELLNSANMALAMAPLLTQGAIDAILHHGSEEQKEKYLLKMVSAEWTGSMNLTEPDAGSDVGALRTKAVKQDDGTYRISGQKIFITFGEHDFTDNIVHLVLARTPDAPTGTKGISLFIVPKFLVNDDGSLGERNDVHIVSIEHKMGIKASPTCVLAYGDNSDGAVGYLVGEENAGMRYMFTMMNNARLGVGVEGLGLAERAYQHALTYAKERKQGYAPGAARGEKSSIIEHPDVFDPPGNGYRVSLLAPGDQAWVERPGYPDTAALLRASGALVAMARAVAASGPRNHCASGVTKPCLGRNRMSSGRRPRIVALSSHLPWVAVS